MWDESKSKEKVVRIIGSKKIRKEGKMHVKMCRYVYLEVNRGGKCRWKVEIKITIYVGRED